jgi:hypothetical protein
MLNIKGAYVVIGTQAPIAVILSAGAQSLFDDRIGAVGFDKAVSYTFGHTATNALPCTAECMEFVALNYQGGRTDDVRRLCARIALGEPIGDGKDYGEQDGGQHARIDAPKPMPSPSGMTAQNLPASTQTVAAL